MSDKRQKNQLVLAFREESRSESPTASAEGTESLAAKPRTESPAIGEQLMEEVCERENCKQALARVKANKGSPGVDRMTVHDLAGHLQQHWPAIRDQLLMSSTESWSDADCGLLGMRTIAIFTFAAVEPESG